MTIIPHGLQTDDGSRLTLIEEGQHITSIKSNPMAKNLQQLTHGVVDGNYNAAWSPDSQSIAFDSSRAAPGIYIMDADGGNQRRLPNQPQRGRMPSWSPDGKQIAFSDTMLGGHRDHLFGGGQDIYTLNVDGSQLRRRTRHPSMDIFPDWSPDGRSIVYYSRWNQKYDIYLIKGGFGQHGGQLTRHPAEDKHPTWVPTGFSPCLANCRDTNDTLWGRLKQSVHD